MKESCSPGLCLVILIAFIPAGRAQVTASATEELAELKQEVRKLHLQILQQQLEFQEWKMRSLAPALRQLQADRQQATEQLRVNRAEIAELEMSMSASTEHGRLELQSLTEKLAKDRLPKLEARLQSILGLESALSGEIDAERVRGDKIQAQIQRINTEPGAAAK